MAAPNKIKVVDHGANELLKKLKSRIGVRAGIFGGANSEVAYIAAIHEFGVANAGRNHNIVIPRRSWLRDYVDNDIVKIRKRLRNAAKQSTLGNMSLKKAFDIFGAATQGDIQARISTSIPPPNAESTIVQKKSSTTLIGANPGGTMRSSITWVTEVDK